MVCELYLNKLVNKNYRSVINFPWGRVSISFPGVPQINKTRLAGSVVWLWSQTHPDLYPGSLPPCAPGQVTLLTSWRLISLLWKMGILTLRHRTMWRSTSLTHVKCPALGLTAWQWAWSSSLLLLLLQQSCRVARWVAEWVIRIWLLRWDPFRSIQNDESASWSPFVCTGSALFYPRFAMEGHRPFSLLSHQIQNKGPANVTEHGHQGLVTALEMGALSVSCPRKKRAARQNSFPWFFVGWAGLHMFNNCPLGHKKPWYVVCANIHGVLSPGLTSSHQCDITEYGVGKRCTQSVISRWGNGCWRIIVFTG